MALDIFAAGMVGSRWAGRVAQQSLERQTLEPPVRMLLIRIIEALGVPITPLVARIGVAAVAIGLALQAVLSNVMAGLSIIFTKPYKVGSISPSWGRMATP